MKSVQNGSKWIKLDQISISHLSKNVNIKSCHIYHENNHGQLFWTNSDHIGPYLSKMDQTYGGNRQGNEQVASFLAPFREEPGASRDLALWPK